MVRYQFVAMEGYLKMIVMSVVYRVDMIMFPHYNKSKSKVPKKAYFIK